MRTRKELMEQTKQYGWGYTTDAILEVLLDIRDYLAEREKPGIVAETVYGRAPLNFTPHPLPPAPSTEDWREKELYTAIEECIGVRGNKAYDGSYAAPREHYRKILRGLLHSEREKLARKLSDMQHPHHHKKYVQGCDVCAINAALEDVKKLLGV